MTEIAGLSLRSDEARSTRACCRVGHFIEKGGCFALADQSGGSIWLEIDPVPLHLLDEEVEITGEQFGSELIWVQTIGPVRD
jgi:Protein of unknown function (DUF5818)